MTSKKAMRQQGLASRRSLASRQRMAKSAQIADKLCHSRLFQQAESIFCYVGSEDEVHTIEILQRAIGQKKLLTVPYITDAANGIMEAAVLQVIEALVPGVYDIPTAPKKDRCFLAGSSIDLVIVPGTAFDKDCHRIGMGGGFYDRFLQHTHACSVALAYECQIFEHLPVEMHDRQVDYIFTESKIYTREDLR